MWHPRRSHDAVVQVGSAANRSAETRVDLPRGTSATGAAPADRGCVPPAVPRSSPCPGDPRDHGPRVLVVTRCAGAFGPSKPGADVLAVRQAVVLRREGLDLSLVCSRALAPSSDQWALPVDTAGRRFGGRGPEVAPALYLLDELFNSVRATLAGLHTMRSQRFDVVVAHSSVSAIICRIFSRGEVVVYYMHDNPSSHVAAVGPVMTLTRFLLNTVLERVATKVSSSIICPSGAASSWILKGRVPQEKVTVLRPIPDPSPHDEVLEPAVGALRTSHPGKKIVLSVGQQTGRKRFDLLISAISGLPTDVILYIVGDGPLNRTYRDLACRLGLGDRVVFFKNVGDDDLVGLYRSAAVFALVSENEGFPITAAEALAHGCPVFLAYPGATSEFGHTPPFVRTVDTPGSPTVIAENLAALLGLRHRVAQPSRAEIREFADRLCPSSQDLLESYLRAVAAGLAQGDRRHGPGPRMAARKGAGT